MVLRSQIESLLSRQVSELTDCEEFRALETGQASRDEYERFLANVVKTHLRSPQVLAFLYALAPPRPRTTSPTTCSRSSASRRNPGSPTLGSLRNLATGSGLANRLAPLEVAAQETLRQAISEPILYGTLKEVGLASLVEVVAFEFMLSRLASRISRALAHEMGLSADTLEWFTHHSEVDIAHAEQGLDAIRD